MVELRERQIRLFHELMYQVKVQEVMTRDVVCFPSNSTFRQVQLSMKDRKFSGTPIVDDGLLVGIVSIQDIITAFDRGYIDQPVGSYMVRDVVTIPQSYSVMAASNMFNKHRYGRLPVVSAPGSRTVVGILTYGDILSQLLVRVNAIAERFESLDHALENVVRDGGNRLHFELLPDNFERAGTASTAIKKHLQERGVPPALLRRVAVICYEAEMNVIIHSLGGFLEVQLLPDRVVINAVDEGPGIPDVERAMQPGYTTSNEKIRSLGFGAGMGLVNMKRCADQFTVRSSMETGTEVEAVVLLEPQAASGSAASAPVSGGKHDAA